MLQTERHFLVVSYSLVQSLSRLNIDMTCILRKKDGIKSFLFACEQLEKEENHTDEVVESI